MSTKLLALAAAILLQDHPPEEAAGKPARARANLQQYFSTDDYPEASQRRRAEGVVHFSLEIDAEGRPSRCDIRYSSGDVDLDQATCTILMSRARFSPARDSNGRAVPDRVTNRIRWMLPEAQGYPFVPLWMALSVSITAGRIACQAWNSYADPERREGADCDDMADRETVQLLRDLGVDTELTQYWRLHPNGAAPPTAEPAIEGELVMETTLRLSVAPDGRVAECRVAGRIVHPRLGSEFRVEDICGHRTLTQPKAFWPNPDTTEPRLGVLTFRLYMRGGVRQPR